MAVASSLAVGLWLAALNVKYRDVRYTVPFLTQFWMYHYTGSLFNGVDPTEMVVSGQPEPDDRVWSKAFVGRSWVKRLISYPWF